MKSLVFIPTKHLQIIVGVVAAITIFMMNDFVAPQFATEVFLGDDRVFSNVSAIDPEKLIAAMYVRPTSKVFSSLRRSRPWLPISAYASGVTRTKTVSVMTPRTPSDFAKPAGDVELRNLRRSVSLHPHVVGQAQTSGTTASRAMLDPATMSGSARSRTAPLLIVRLTLSAFDREPSASADLTLFVVSGSHAPGSIAWPRERQRA